MRRSRINYWSCSRFADWARGEKKPPALEWNAWEEWRRETSARRPFRFFLAEKVLDVLQDIVMFPRDMLDSIYSWWYNRFVSKTHYLKTGLRPGKLHELDDRILHGLFNEFVEFVEVDLAHMQAWGEKKYVFRKGRCPEAGVDHLLWASDLKYDEFMEKDDPLWGKPTPQAEAAIKMLEIYRWWTEARPNRPDPMEESGWSEHYDGKDEEKKDVASKKLQELEESYDSEDERMLVDLIKIRKSLWT